jgi:hypothetical protein
MPVVEVKDAVYVHLEKRAKTQGVSVMDYVSHLVPSTHSNGT